MSLSNKRVVVTGSASGIGEATVALLREKGATVIGLDRKERTDNVDEFHRVELTDFSSIDNAINEVSGPIHGLCNIAGIPPRPNNAPLVLMVNFVALRRLTTTIVPKLSDGASIANVASIAGFGWQQNTERVKKGLALSDDADLETFCKENDIGYPNSYPFSKECVIAWTKQSNRRWADRGIRSNSVSPGPVETPILEEFVTAFGEKARKDIERVGRAGRPEDIAPVIAFLLDDESRWIRGTNIAVDGGIEGIFFENMLHFDG
ncbi:MAG: coniferyl-alcohol dehydrogenase [Deltaproteobacteria bacterium]|nr:coniferyl-alcohol dehydrogenase [Deltaproteobacteria bacterium]